MNRKSKLFFSLVSLCFSIAVLCFGVYSALSVSYSISGSVSYEIKDVFVSVTRKVYRALSETPVQSSHSGNVTELKTAQTIDTSKYDDIDAGDSFSTYDNGNVTSSGQDYTYPEDGDESKNIDLTYGSPTGNETQGYAFYIVIDIHNLGSEIINAQITAPTSLENTILRDSGNVEITANGTERIVLGLALDDVTTGITSADFTYTITISPEGLPAEPITDMTFTFNEDNKTATLTSYTGTDTMVEIPETVGAAKQTTKTFGTYADISALMTSLTGTSTGMVDAYLVGDISYTSGNEQNVAENQMIYSWMQDDTNASCTDIKIECKDSYTLTMSASDMGETMLGPAAGYVMVASSDDPTILDSMSMSYTIRLNNEEFYIDKNAVMQFIENNSGDLVDYFNLAVQLFGAGTQKITVSFEDIVYDYDITSGTGYTITSITDGRSSTDSLDEIMPMFPSTVESISLPNTLIYIQYHAFEGTQWLEGLRNQEGYNGIITSRDGSTKYYLETPQGAQLTAEYVNTILQDVQVIGDRAFYQTELSGDIVIPNGVKGIGLEAFSDTTISSITFGANSQLESIGDSAFYNCSNLTSIKIPSSVTSIGSGAFFNCSALKTVTFGANSQLESIEERTFYSCSSLTSIEIPNSVTSIGEDAFEDCSVLETVTFEDDSQLKSIGDRIFEGCSNLISIEIPSNVTSIGDYVFQGCSALETVTFCENSKLESIGRHAFSYCSNLTSIKIPSGVISIGEAAFTYCYALAEVYNYSTQIPPVTIGNSSPNTNGYLGQYAKVVYNPSDLTGEKLATRIQPIGNVQYYKDGEDFIALAPSVARDSLTTLTLDSRTTEINQYAFSGCSALGTVTFGDNSQLKSIGDSVFSGCSILTSIEIPSSVTSIGYSAFSGCSALETVKFENTDSIWMVNNTEIAISKHTAQELATYLRSNYCYSSWTKKQSA